MQLLVGCLPSLSGIKHVRLIKKIFVNSAIYAIAPQIPQLLSVLMLPILTPYLTSTDYGIYGILIAYLTALSALKDLGFGVVLTNTFYKYPLRFHHFWNRIFSFISLWSVIVAGLMALVIYVALPVQEKSNWLLLTLCYCAPVALFDATRWVVGKYLQLREKAAVSMLIVVVSSLLGIACNVITIRFLKMGYMGWFISGLVISLASFLPQLYILVKRLKLKPSFSYNYKWLKPSLAVALPVLPHTYANYLLDSSDRLLLSWFKIEISQIGIYNIAYIFGGYYAMAATALATATGPTYFQMLAKNDAKSEADVKRLTFLLESILLVGGIFICIWFKEIFFLFVKNDELNDAYGIAIVILMSYTAKALYFAPVCKLQFEGKTNQFWKISLLGGLLNIVLNLILIPFWGVWGSVVATFISMMYISLSGYGVKDFIRLNKEKYYPMSWLTVIVMATGFCYLIKDISIVYKVIFSLALGILALFAYRNYRHWLQPMAK